MKQIFFFQILKYYHDRNLPSLSTQHLSSAISKYSDWNDACIDTLQQLNITSMYQNKQIEHTHVVTISEMKTRIRSSLKHAAYLSKLVIYSQFKNIAEIKTETEFDWFFSPKIRSRGTHLVNDMDICLGALRASFSTFHTHLNRLPQNDIPFAVPPFAISDNPLKQMVLQYYRNYHNYLFLWISNITIWIAIWIDFTNFVNRICLCPPMKLF